MLRRAVLLLMCIVVVFGRIFLFFCGSPFLSKENNIAFMLNIDWFQPFKHRAYSIGVMYLVFMNLPCSIRYKRENIVLLGLIPGPSEPPLHINSYLTPHVADLLSLWKGVSFDTATHKTVIVRCALLQGRTLVVSWLPGNPPQYSKGGGAHQRQMCAPCA